VLANSVVSELSSRRGTDSRPSFLNETGAPGVIIAFADVQGTSSDTQHAYIRIVSGRFVFMAHSSLEFNVNAEQIALLLCHIYRLRESGDFRKSGSFRDFTLEEHHRLVLEVGLNGLDRIVYVKLTKEVLARLSGHHTDNAMRCWRYEMDDGTQAKSMTFAMSDDEQVGCTLFMYDSDVCDDVVKEHLQDEWRNKDRTTTFVKHNTVSILFSKLELSSVVFNEVLDDSVAKDYDSLSSVCVAIIADDIDEVPYLRQG